MTATIVTKIAVNIGRLLMAATFIFSGFVKGIDPLGTQYKITDYLEALHIDWMFPVVEHTGDVGICLPCASLPSVSSCSLPSAEDWSARLPCS